ncbi:hypothetical protein MY5147_002098 [Beauveria neobassiana]
MEGRFTIVVGVVLVAVQFSHGGVPRVAATKVAFEMHRQRRLQGEVGGRVAGCLGRGGGSGGSDARELDNDGLRLPVQAGVVVVRVGGLVR